MEWHDHIKPSGKYRSKFERAIAEQLLGAGIAFRYENVPLQYGDEHACRNYYPDFQVYTKDGGEAYLEVKGWLNSEAAVKMITVRHQHPDKDIRLVFQSGGTRVAKLKMTSLKWANRVGFPAAEKAIPADWLAEFMTVEERQEAIEARYSEK